MHIRATCAVALAVISLTARPATALCAKVATAARGGFDVVSISVPDGSIWQINRPIEIAFNANVDFSSVNANTIQVRSAADVPAAGSFYLLDPRTVVFQPTCPTEEDYSDAGLLPGGVSYTVFLPGTGMTLPTVLSQSGRELSQPHTVGFTTPNSTSPAVLFFDVLPGAPRPVVRTSASVLDACFLRIGEDPSQDVYFVPRAVADASLGADVPAGFVAPLNLYSTPSTRLAAYVQLNQPIDGTPVNVDTDRLKLEYQTAPATWAALSREVELVANCTQSGAVVRVAPLGILPQGRIVRIVLAAGFSDIAGNPLPAPVVVGSFLVATAVDPGTTNPGDGGDEVLEEFLVGGGGPDSLEDPSALVRQPGAIWEDGRLSASLAAFEGTGGPGGDFDWEIGNDPGGAPESILLDTTFSVIVNADQTAQQTVINGLVDVRNVHVKATGLLVIQGPNPCRILATGAVRIDGRVRGNGFSNPGVNTLNTTNITEPGAAGNAGGGRGGNGNPLTTQSSPAGANGFGAFNTPEAGGRGGESAYNPLWPIDLQDEHRRPGGGGGGALAMDLLRPAGIGGGYTNPNSCPDQGVIGLDAEKGFPGYPQAVGVITGGMPPQGGIPGVLPFPNGNPADDFWGTMRTQSGQLIQGELSTPWAGAGGGGGGNAINSNSFPTTPFDCCGFYSDEKGAGAGGGGGSIEVHALGAIEFGPSGRIEVSGGTGGGGENPLSGGVTHIGGGSGGGSGGHVVLETATRIDLSQSRSTSNPPGGIYALGGQGGAGANDFGGAHAGGVATPPQLDALPPNSYPNDVAPCGVVAGVAGYTFSNTVGNNDPTHVVICAGGDGGPGLVQLHAPTLADILAPTTSGEDVYDVVKPAPVGSYAAGAVPDHTTINTPALWDQMLPSYGRKSQAVSKWIALGAASVDPTSTLPDPVGFLFGGTGPHGNVRTIGSGSGATVGHLPPIFSGTLATLPTRPYVAADLRTLVIDGTRLPDDVYLRSPPLLRRFALEMTQGTTDEFEIGSATFDATTGDLRLTVAEGGMPLAPYAPGAGVELRPHFFRVATDGVKDSLPDSARIRIEFQATTQTAEGEPDLGGVSAWKADLTALDPNVGSNPDFHFLRFRVSFDVSTNGASLTLETPVPSLDFLRLPFRF